MMVEKSVPDTGKLLAIIASGLASRCLIAALFDPSAVLWLGDTQDYVRSAQFLQAGHFPHVSRAVGYPIFLALTLILGPLGVVLIQCALTIGSAVATYFLLSRTPPAFWTAILIASSPFLAIYDFRLLSETLYVQLLWLGFLLLYQKHWLGSGILIGVAAVVRDTLMLMPLLLVPLALKDRRYLVPSALSAAIIVAAPHGSGRFGINLWIGTWERNGDWYLGGLSKPNFPSYAFRLPGEREKVERVWRKDDATFTRLALSRIQTHPISTAAAWIERYPRLWIGTRMDVMPMRLPSHSLAWWLAKSAFLTLNLLTLALGFWGLSRKRGLFVIPVFYIALIYVPFHNCETRYSLPALPFLYYYAATLLKSKRLSLNTRRTSADRPTVSETFDSP